MNGARETLGQALDALLATIEIRRNAAPNSSYTASLLAGGVPLAARKFGEESVEAIIAALDPSGGSLAKEAADVLFHLGVLISAAGVSPDAIASELALRRGQSGHAEKAARLTD